MNVMAVRKPNAAMVPVRAVLITLAVTLASFVVSLLLGIVGIALDNAVRGGGIDMNRAYRSVAFPIAMVVLAITLVTALVGEVRRYRRQHAAWRESSRAA